MNIIEVSNLKKDYSFSVKEKGFFKRKTKTVKAVNNISFNVSEGETIAFIGPNGAGKSTTIKMLRGILMPTSGSIKVNGLNPFRSPWQLLLR